MYSICNPFDDVMFTNNCHVDWTEVSHLFDMSASAETDIPEGVYSKNKSCRFEQLMLFLHQSVAH